MFVFALFPSPPPSFIIDSVTNKPFRPLPHPPPPFSSIENVNLQGTIPPEIQHLQYLRDTNLSQNPSLVGEVPRVIGKLVHLETFSIDSTNVSGSIEFLCRTHSVEYDNSLLPRADLSKVDCSCCECCK